MTTENKPSLRCNSLSMLGCKVGGTQLLRTADWIFNGGWQLRDTETIHSKSFMVQLHLMSVTAYRRQLKHVVQFWKAKGDFDELIKAFTVKCQRTDHTLDAHFTDISTVHNFEQPLAGLSHWLERLTREEKDSSKYRTSRWQRGKEIITFKR